jgi:hypothetical protein
MLCRCATMPRRSLIITEAMSKQRSGDRRSSPWRSSNSLPPKPPPVLRSRRRRGRGGARSPARRRQRTKCFSEALAQEASLLYIDAINRDLQTKVNGKVLFFRVRAWVTRVPVSGIAPGLEMTKTELQSGGTRWLRFQEKRGKEHARTWPRSRTLYLDKVLHSFCRVGDVGNQVPPSRVFA